MTEPPLGGQFLDHALGFEILESADDHAKGRMRVTDAVRQPMGIVHGGAYAALAESLASVATHQHVSEGGEMAVGQSNHTSFLRPVGEGEVIAEARRRHRGRTSWVWEIDFRDQQGRLCAISRVTLAVRPLPEQAG